MPIDDNDTDDDTDDDDDDDDDDDSPCSRHTIIGALANSAQRRRTETATAKTTATTGR